MGQTLQVIVDQLTGIDDIFFFKLAENKGFCEELLQVILENKNLYSLTFIFAENEMYGLLNACDFQENCGK